MKIGTGIDGLDKFMDGGFDPGSIILIEGEKSPKNIFSIQSVKKGICISTLPQNDIKNILKKFKWDDKEIKIISIGSGEGDKSVESPSSLEDISIAIKELSSGKKETIIINSLSSLIMHNSLERMVDFLQSIIKKCKTNKSILMLVIDEETMKDVSKNTVKDICDLTISFVKDEAGDFIQVINGYPHSLLEFKIGAKGIFLTEDFL